MHIIKLKITGNNVGARGFFDQAGHYLSLLYRSKQIINQEWHYEPITNGVQLNLYCPEKFSYTAGFSTKHSRKQKENIESEYECIFEFKYVGIDPGFGETRAPEGPEFYILKIGDISPLTDGGPFDQAPLYKIPYTYEDKECYWDLTKWESKYEHIKGIWLTGYGNDKWSLAQLQNHDSELNIEGMECCKTIKKLTGKPTYYFLFNDCAWGQKKTEKELPPL